ncbi:hypothetical protein Tco_0764779 [Tanacetum coccineum]
MCNYLKNMEGCKLKDLTHFSFDVIQEKFDRAYQRINTFVDMNTELVGSSKQRAATEQESSKKAGNDLNQESVKKQKVTNKEDTAKLPTDDQETLELQQMIQIVPNEEGVKIDALNFFRDLLRAFDKDDLVDLWKLVKSRYGSTRPKDDMDRLLWIDLGRMFEPDPLDDIWRHQHNSHVLHWILYGSCGVYHLVMKDMIVYFLVEKKYPLSQATLTMMLNEKLKNPLRCSKKCLFKKLDDVEVKYQVKGGLLGIQDFKSEVSAARRNLVLPVLS